MNFIALKMLTGECKWPPTTANEEINFNRKNRKKGN